MYSGQTQGGRFILGVINYRERDPMLLYTILAAVVLTAATVQGGRIPVKEEPRLDTEESSSCGGRTRMAVERSPKCSLP